MSAELLKAAGLEGLSPEELATEVNARLTRPRGRPKGKKAQNYNLSLKTDVLQWLSNHPEGPASVADRLFRAEMEREKTTSR